MHEVNIFRDDSEIDRILNHENNKVNHKTIGQGNNQTTRKEEYTKRPLEEKANIGVLATLLGNKATSDLTGVDPTQVSAYKNATKAIGNGVNIKDQELKSELSDRLAPIRNRALDKVDLFMEILSSEKALKMKGRDLASAAKNMVEIYDKLGPKVDNPLFQARTVVFYSPKVRESIDYPVIEIEAVQVQS